MHTCTHTQLGWLYVVCSPRRRQGDLWLHTHTQHTHTRSPKCQLLSAASCCSPSPEPSPLPLLLLRSFASCVFRLCVFVWCVCVCVAHKLCGNIADLPHNGSRSRGGAYAYFYYFMQRKTNRAASVFFLGRIRGEASGVKPQPGWSVWSLVKAIS